MVASKLIGLLDPCIKVGDPLAPGQDSGDWTNTARSLCSDKHEMCVGGFRRIVAPLYAGTAGRSSIVQIQLAMSLLGWVVSCHCPDAEKARRKIRPSRSLYVECPWSWDEQCLRSKSVRNDSTDQTSTSAETTQRGQCDQATVSHIGWKVDLTCVLSPSAW